MAAVQHPTHSPLPGEPLGRELPGHQPGRDDRGRGRSTAAAARPAPSASSTSCRRPASPSMLGASPFGMPIAFAPRIRQRRGRVPAHPRGDDVSQQLSLSGARADHLGQPLAGRPRQGTRRLPERGRPRGLLRHRRRARTRTADQTADGALLPSPAPARSADPKVYPPRAYLTLPTACQGPTGLDRHRHLLAGSRSGQPHLREPRRRRPAADSAGLRSAGGRTRRRLGSADLRPRRLGHRARLQPDQEPDALLDNFTPTGRLIAPVQAPSQVKRAVVTLPQGMTINPSVAAGLGVCTPAQYAAETATSPPGAGCPNDSKIGE